MLSGFQVTICFFKNLVLHIKRNSDEILFTFSLMEKIFFFVFTQILNKKKYSREQKSLFHTFFFFFFNSFHTKTLKIPINFFFIWFHTWKKNLLTFFFSDNIYLFIYLFMTIHRCCFFSPMNSLVFFFNHLILHMDFFFVFSPITFFVLLHGWKR